MSAPCSCPGAAWFHDLPVGVFADDLSVPEGIEIATADFDLRAAPRRPGEQPFRDQGVSAHAVLEVSIVNIGRGFEAAGLAAAHDVPPSIQVSVGQTGGATGR